MMPPIMDLVAMTGRSRLLFESPFFVLWSLIFAVEICSSAVYLQSSQLYALQSLKQEFEHIGSFITSASSIPSACNDLNGVNCTSDGFVSSIFLSLKEERLPLNYLGNESQTANLSSTICNFTHLEHLELTYLQLFGRIPDCFGSLSNLVHLDLKGNYLSGIPESIGNLSRLQYLDLSSNIYGFNGFPEAITNLFNLRYLNLSGLSLDGHIPSIFGDLKQLQTLDLSRNCLDDDIPDTLLQLPALKYLNLAMNFLTGDVLENIGSLQSLQSLDLGYNKFTGKLPATFPKNITSLVLRHNRFTKISPLAFLNLTYLEYLDLSSNEITGQFPDNWTEFHAIKSINLNINNFSGNLPSTLGNLPNLQFLLCSHNSFSGSLPQSLNAARIQEIDLSYNLLSGGIPLPLAGSGENSRIKHLNLGCNYLRGPLLIQLMMLTSLEYLDLSYNFLSGTIPPSIGQLKNLEYLFLSFNSFLGYIPSEIAELARLKVLSISSCSLQGSLPSLSNLSYLSSIDLSFNQLAGSVPDDFVSYNVSQIQLHGNLLLGDVSFFSTMANIEELILDNNQFSGILPSINSKVLSLKHNYFSLVLYPEFYKDMILRLSGNSAICKSPAGQAALIPSINSSCNASATLNFKSDPICTQNVCLRNMTNNPIIFQENGSCICSHCFHLLLLFPNPAFIAITPQINLQLIRILMSIMDSNFGANASKVYSMSVLTGRHFPNGSVSFHIIACANHNLDDGHLMDHMAEYLLQDWIYVDGLFGYMIAFQVQDPSDANDSFPNSRKRSNSVSVPIFAMYLMSFGALALIIFCMLTSCMLYICLSGLRKQGEKRRVYALSPFASQLQKDSVHPFTLEEIESATDGFSEANFIGEGSFGTVHLGHGPDGRKWAVKRREAATAMSLILFHNEVAVMSKVSHINIVRLVGFCDELEEQILVYEYMEGGTLKSRLHPDEGDDLTPLTLNERLQIAIGVAEGLTYMHNYQSPAIIHRDIKSDNILLDSDGTAKIADFGFLRNLGDKSVNTCSKAIGTLGYIDPEYYDTLRVTTKSDVYSFGVVLLELITGRDTLLRHPYGEDCMTISKWVISQVELNQRLEIVDPHLEGQYLEEDILDLVDLAMWCIHKSRVSRPDIHTVARRLVDISVKAMSQISPLHDRVMPGI